MTFAKSCKERPRKVEIDGLHEYIDSLEKHREEREFKLQTMLDIKFASFEDNI